MHLVIPGLADFPSTEVPGLTSYEIADGARFEVYPLVALPADLSTWGVTVVGVAPEIDLVHVLEKTTELGWPVTVVQSELRNPVTGTVREHRLYSLYRFLEWGGVTILRARDAAIFDAALLQLVPLLKHVRPDFTSDATAVLAQLWAYL